MNEQKLKKFAVGQFSGGRLIRSMLLIPIFVYLGLFIVAHFYAEGIIFQPQPSTYQDTNEIIKVAVSNSESISAIHLNNQESKYTILFNHGNAEDLGTIRTTLEELRGMGFSVFSYDYRGYGTSSGKASEGNSYEDAATTYRYMVEKLQIPPDKIIVFGRSLGGAVAIDLASKRLVGGLVIESSFVTAFRVMTQVSLFPIDRFNSLSKIGSVRCPVLVIHGTRDELIQIWHGEMLLREANEPKFSFWVEGAGHNNLRSFAGKSYDKSLIDFASFLDGR